MIEADAGTSLLKAAAQAGINIKSGCGGKGTCGACKIVVLSGEPLVTGTGYLTPEQIFSGVRLACQTIIKSDLTVLVPPESRLKKHQVLMGDVHKEILQESKQDLLHRFGYHPLAMKTRISLSPPTLTSNMSDWDRVVLELKRVFRTGDKPLHIPLSILKNLPETLRKANWDVSVTLSGEPNSGLTVIHIEPGNERPSYGLAIDIGTTTVVVYLINLLTGEIADQQGGYNKQAKFGDDVISRIVYATEEVKHLEEIQHTVIETINELIDTILVRQSLTSYNISCAMIVGNTTMIQLFLGVDPRYIRLEPYIPTMANIPSVPAREIGLHMIPESLVHCYPSVASYVGGDIVAGTLVTDLANGEEICLFIDIGTNGEIVLGNKDWLMACACSAGPSFEGGGITFGMRAMRGAIERVIIDPDSLDVSLKVIGESLPIGICGSGLVDCVAKLRETGIIDRAGNFQLEHHSYSGRLRATNNDKEFVLAWADQAGGDKDVVITENDVKNFIRAKASIYAGICSLLKMVAVDMEMISKIIIAGGFGNYLNVHDAIQIGLLPDVETERFEFVGNASIKGARLALLSQNAWQEAAALGRRMTYVELSVGATFMEEYVSALFLPHTDLSQFPSCKY
ncbi:MAG: ASKHA domain-containing protein [Desulfosporosinus sp.]